MFATTTTSSLPCCIPKGTCLRNDGSQTLPKSLSLSLSSQQSTVASRSLIALNDLRDTIRVICTNKKCPHGSFMHRECFQQWEQSVLIYLKRSAGAKIWSERQRQQNLWTDRGFEFAWKACICKCNSGALRKDLTWIAPPPIFDFLREQRQKREQQLNLNFNCFLDGNGRNGRNNDDVDDGDGDDEDPKWIFRHNRHHPAPPLIPDRELGKLLRDDEHGGGHSDALDNHNLSSTINGLFHKRTDFKSFSRFPQHTINSTSIKIEDDGYYNTDDIRYFVLSNLSQNKQSKMRCLLCSDTLLVYDKYPLIDGVFFLSPRQYSPSDSIQVKLADKNQQQYLSCVCIQCLQCTKKNSHEKSRQIFCRFCEQPWNGSLYILGTMYFYDIFAAVQCCRRRQQCNECGHLISSNRHRTNFAIRLKFNSDFNHLTPCFECRSLDIHFVKPLHETFRKIASLAATASTPATTPTTKNNTKSSLEIRNLIIDDVVDHSLFLSSSSSFSSSSSSSYSSSYNLSDVSSSASSSLLASPTQKILTRKHKQPSLPITTTTTNTTTPITPINPFFSSSSSASLSYSTKDPFNNCPNKMRQFVDIDFDYDFDLELNSDFEQILRESSANLAAAFS